VRRTPEGPVADFSFHFREELAEAVPNFVRRAYLWSPGQPFFFFFIFLFASCVAVWFGPLVLAAKSVFLLLLLFFSKKK